MAEVTGVGTATAKAGATVLGRGVSLIFSKVMRVRQIGAAAKGKAKDANVRTVLSDYQTYLVTSRGQYSVSVKDFHEELLRSGVVDGMVELAIVGRESRVVRAAFDNVFDRFLDDEIDADQMYEEMLSSFRSSIRMLTSEPTVLRFIEVFSRQINDRLDQVEASFGGRPGPPLPVNIDEITNEVISGLYNHYKTLKVETVGGVARDVDVSEIYVPPSLQLRGTRRSLASIAEFVPAEDLARMADASGAPRRTRSDPIYQLTHYKYQELRDTFRRVVVLGDPGGGKSTLCQRICFDLARASMLSAQYGGKNYVPFEEQRVPFRIILRKFEQARISEPQLTLLTYIIRELKAYTSADDADIRSTVIYLLKSGRAVLAFDGLDEILDTSNRRSYVDLVNSLCNQFPLCPVIVTSRFVGYESAPLPKDFDRVILQKFNDTEITSYARKFMVEIGDLDSKEAETESARFMLQTKDNASDLRKNPLMLGLMLWIFLVKGDVPSNRPAIYAECSNLMFDKWDSNRGIRPLLPKGFDRSQLFSSIAALIYPDRTLRAGVSREWLLRHLVAYFSDKFVNPADAQDAAVSLADFLVGRAWIMMESGEGVFSFTHQTFMEYFYAKHVVSKYDSVKDLFRIVRSDISKKERDVVNHLSLQIKTHGNDRRQVEAIDEILRYRSRLSKPGSVQAVLHFASKSLEYLVPTEADVRRVVEDIYEFAVVRDDNYFDVGLLSSSLLSCNLRRDFVEQEIVRLLTHDVTSPDDVRSERALQYMVVAGKSQWSSGGHNGKLPLAEAAKAAREHIVRKAETKASWALACWSLFAYAKPEWLRRYGLQNYAEQELVTGFEYLSSFDALPLACAAGYREYYHRGTIKERAVQEALVLIGDVGFSLAAEGPVHLRRPESQIDFPVDMWTEAFDELSDKPDHFKGALFAFASYVEDDRMSRRHDYEEELKKIRVIMAAFERRYGGWSGMTDATRAALRGEKGLFFGHPTARDS